MNETISQLAEQAGQVSFDSDNDLTLVVSTDEKSYEVPASFIEVFAELIVKECIGCCEQVISDPVPELVDTWLNGGEQCIQEIRKHFGVEE